MMSKFHHFFLLSMSPWPLIISFNSFNMFFSFVLMMKYKELNSLALSLAVMIIISFAWWSNYKNEFDYEGMNSMNLEKGLKFAMILFISSEIFFFFSFFWSYFHFFLNPVMELGMVWPPFSILMFDYSNVPLINTLILMSSGLTITLSHQFLVSGKSKFTNIFLFTTVILGLVFTILQALEYQSSFFSVSDSSFGTSFFLLTGFHGIHVIIGTIFLMKVLNFGLKISLAKSNSLSFELASWYWHFVDVVWLFLYFFIYYMNM